MTDLFAVFSKLVTGKGEILIPGINDLIAPLTDEERKRYEVMDFNLAVRPRTITGRSLAQEYGQAVGGDITMHDDGVNTLMGRMRFPSLSIHGIEGAFSAPGSCVAASLASLTASQEDRHSSVASSPSLR